MNNVTLDPIAIWVVTPNGLALAEQIIAKRPGAELFVSAKLEPRAPRRSFARLAEAVADNFEAYTGHVFITATGIAVRVIAPHLSHKTKDPAVVVLDEQAQHAVSLLSGHIGGANALAVEIGEITGARPVITTATDVSGVPAIDTLAVKSGLLIENSAAIKAVNMAFIRREKVGLYDPADILAGAIPRRFLIRVSLLADQWPGSAAIPGICVSDTVVTVPESVLVLRPRSLAAGIGCNRNTTAEEIETLLRNTLAQHSLSLNSLKTIASIDIKNDEPGLLTLAEKLKLPLVFYKKEALNAATGIENPSAMVETHTGAKSVCEAAAILATGPGSLVVPKKKSQNVTVAIARAVST